LAVSQPLYLDDSTSEEANMALRSGCQNNGRVFEHARSFLVL
jgi:hypothetical protein